MIICLNGILQGWCLIDEIKWPKPNENLQLIPRWENKDKNYREQKLERTEAAEYHAVEDTAQCSQEEISPKSAHMEFLGNQRTWKTPKSNMSANKTWSYK